MPSLVNKKPISVTLDSNGNPTTLVEFEDTVSTRHVVPVIHGGTGADDAAGARTALGLGSIATLSEIGLSNLASNIDASSIGFIAYKAEQLETARTIAGVSFDGTANITLNSDNISEGSSNLYFTNAKARSAISVTDSGGDGSLAYNSSTGVITYTGPSASEVQAHITAGTGVSISSGQISIGQAVATTSDVTFNDVTVSGDLTVSGTTTTINTETLTVDDNIIVLNNNVTGSPSENAGIEIERGSDTNKTLIWNETDDKWTVGSETFVAGTLEGTLNSSTINFENNTGIIEFAVTVSNPGSGNKYFIDGEETARIQLIPGLTYRFDVSSNTVSGHPFRFSTTSDGTHNSGTNYSTGVTVSGTTGTSGAYVQIVVDAATPDLLYYYCTSHSGMGGTGAISISGTNLGSNDTDDLSEGSTNLYYTNARFDTRLAAKDTGDLSEGSNLYFTNARADARVNLQTGSNLDLSSKDTDDLSEGSSNLYYTDTRVGNYLTTNSYATQSYVNSAVASENEISEMNDVTLTSLATNEVLRYNGSAWVNVALTTTNVSEGTNLYYTDARFDTRLGTKTTDNLTEGSSNLYFTNTRFTTQFNTKDTDNLSEGSTNLYHTTERVQDVVGGQIVTNGSHTGISFAYDDANDGAIDATVSLSGFNTGNLSEGSNLYYTNARADARIAAANLEDIGDIGYTNPGSSDDGKVLFWDNSSSSYLLSSVSGLAGSGEVNTASNVGTAGVGIFKQKSSEELQFKKINAGSAKITVTDDTSNDEIDINLGAVAIGDLSNVSSTSPSNEQVLQYNSSAGEWQPATSSGVSLGLVLALS